LHDHCIGFKFFVVSSLNHRDVHKEARDFESII
jgi:hypothetical protein